MLDWLRSIVPYLKDRTPKTAGQDAEALRHWGSFVYNRKRPFFNRMLVQAMLADPHVKFGLYLIKGPILSGSRFVIQCEDQRVKDFLVKQVTRFWSKSAKQALRSLHYGWFGSEVMYRVVEDMLSFDCLCALDPERVFPMVHNGGLSGMMISSQAKELYLPPVKSFWSVHARENHRWWGQSRLYGAHIPWFEYNANEGFRDSRKLFFYKCAFDSGVLRYPWGSSQTPDGRLIDNRDIAQEIIDKYRNGSGMTLPQSVDAARNWDWERPQSQDVSQSFTEYGKDLRDEIWEALGVPPEIAKAQGTGAYAGRQIPQEAFYALLQEIVQDLITDFDEQVLAPLTLLNFGALHAPYEIECYGLLRSLEDDRGNHKDDARQPLGLGLPNEGGDQTADAHLTNRPPQIQMSQVCLAHRPAPETVAWAATQRT